MQQTKMDEMKVNSTTWDSNNTSTMQVQKKQAKKQQVREETVADNLPNLMYTDLNGQAGDCIPTQIYTGPYGDRA